LEDLRRFAEQTRKPPEVVAAQLAEIERSRDAEGFVGE